MDNNKKDEKYEKLIKALEVSSDEKGEKLNPTQGGTEYDMEDNLKDPLVVKEAEALVADKPPVVAEEREKEEERKQEAER